MWGKTGRSHLLKEILPFAVISVTGIGFALFTASMAHNFADSHHLHHLVRTVLVVGTNVASFGILWVFKFLILNRLFAQIPDVDEVGRRGLSPDRGRAAIRRIRPPTPQF